MVNGVRKSMFEQKGISSQEILKVIDDQRQQDVKWREGRSFSLSYFGGDDVYDLSQKVASKFLCDNPLNPTAFPSLKKFENEVVMMVRDLLGGDSSCAGTMTTGGTESILLALKSARSWAKVNKPDVKVPEVIVPNTVHPAFQKGAYYFGIKIVEINVGKDFKPDPEVYRSSVTQNTIICLLYTSPSPRDATLSRMPSSA